MNGLKSGRLHSNGDGYVSLNDIYDYVLTRLQDDTQQIPERHFDHTVGDVAMARSRPSMTIVKRPDGPVRPELAASETETESRTFRPGSSFPQK